MGQYAAAIGPALNMFGTALSVQGDLAQGNAALNTQKARKIETDFEATQLNQDAGQAIAVSQRNAADVGRQTTLINSQALARAAASGAGASDPSVIGTIARTAGEGAYRKGVALYEGEAQARMDRLRATAATLEGDLGVAAGEAAKRLSRTQAISTAISGMTNSYSMYRKYNPSAGSGGGMATGDNFSWQG